MRNQLEAILGDRELDFSNGAAGFQPGVNSGKVFVMTITNGNVATRTAYISPGLIYDPTGTVANGIVQTGAFNDKDGSAGLVGSSGGYGTIEALFAYIQKNPTVCQGIKLSSTVATQLDLSITFTPQNPFQSLESLSLSLAQWKNERNDNDKFLTVPYKFFLDGETRIELPIAGSSTCNIIFYCGASLNRNHKLKTMNAEAELAINNAGGAGRVQNAINHAGNQRRIG